MTSLTVGQLLPLVSLVGIVLAALGTVLRARWGSMVGFATAAILAVVTFGVLTVENRGALSPSHHAIACAMVTGSFLAGLAAPILAWRGTRPGAGELRSLLLA